MLFRQIKGWLASQLREDEECVSSPDQGNEKSFATTFRASPIPIIEYEAIRTNMNTMTSVAWNLYVNSLIGKKVMWQGWVKDVHQPWTGGYNLQIDMDPPGTVSMPDVTIEGISEATAAVMQKDQPIRFSGVITSVFSLLGSCQIGLKNANLAR